jgi:phage-related baseplate assembly protein
LAEENYILWQTSKMGRDINPSYFNAMLMESGIKRVEITKPAFTAISKGSVAVVRDCNISFGGVEDE